MERKQVWMMPGFSAIPPSVLQAMTQASFQRGSHELVQVFQEILDQLQTCFRTQNRVLLLPTTPIGVLEATVINLLSPGEKVLALCNGVSGERFAKIASVFGADVTKFEAEWGQAVAPDAVRRRLESPDLGNLKVVLLVHDESSTGVLNDLGELAQVIRMQKPDVLLLVDATGSLLTADLETDEWQLDAVVGGSPFAWMTPSGLAFVALSERAWEAFEENRNPKYAFDFSLLQKALERGQAGWTPSPALLYGFREALRLIESEGLQKSICRHHTLGRAARAAMQALGLHLFADPQHASPTTTAVYAPPGVEPKALRRLLRETYGVVMAGSQSRIENEVFRIGHAGWVGATDLLAAIAAIELALSELNYPVRLGAGVAAAQKVFLGTCEGRFDPCQKCW